MKRAPSFNITTLVRGKKFQLGVLAALAVVGVTFFILIAYRFRHELGIDAISYISIAQQYANGLFSAAANAYWSPMISWLMSPLIAFGLDGVAAFLTINVLAASFVLTFGAYMVWRMTAQKFMPALIFMLISFPLLYDSIRILTPDLLTLVWVVIFVTTAVKVSQIIPIKGQEWQWAVAIGAIGAFGYFVKLYLVPVFVAFLLLWGLTCLVDQKSKRLRINTLRFFAFCFFFFGLFSLPWVVSLSVKYDGVMMGSSASVNMSAKFATGSASAKIEQLDAPPNEYAVSFGEDRTTQAVKGGEGPNSSAQEKLAYYINERLKAWPYFLNRISSLWLFTLPVIIMTGIGALLGAIRWRRSDYPVVVLWTLTLVYTLGYAAIAGTSSGGGNVRYYWPITLLSILLACILLPRLKDCIWKIGGVMRKGAFAVLVACIVIVPYVHYLVGVTYFSSIPILNPAALIPSERVIIPHPFEEAQPMPIKELADKIEIDGSVPSGSRLVGDNYRMTMYLAYYLDSQVFGRSNKGNYYNLKEPRKTLNDLNIEYIIQFTPKGEQREVVDEGEVVARYEYEGSCQDSKSLLVEDCSVVIVKRSRE